MRSSRSSHFQRRLPYGICEGKGVILRKKRGQSMLSVKSVKKVKSVSGVPHDLGNATHLVTQAFNCAWEGQTTLSYWLVEPKGPGGWLFPCMWINSAYFFSTLEQSIACRKMAGRGEAMGSGRCEKDSLSSPGIPFIKKNTALSPTNKPGIDRCYLSLRNKQDITLHACFFFNRSFRTLPLS